MDAANPFETPTTYKLHRAEYLVFWLVSVALIIWHFGQIRWLPFVGLFVYIDIIGYIPGAIAFHRSKQRLSPDHPTPVRISKAYYVMYNIMHSMVTQSLVVGLWGLLFGWEWALLAIPFHLFGDRALFGNFLKTFGLSFEPVPNPGYARLIGSLRDQTRSAPPVTVPDELVVQD